MFDIVSITAGVLTGVGVGGYSSIADGNYFENLKFSEMQKCSFFYNYFSIYAYHIP